MATSKIETKVIPITVTLLVEDTLHSTRVNSTPGSTSQRWFMPEARAAVLKSLMIINSEDVTNGRVI